MAEPVPGRAATAIGPTGTILRLEDLPPPDTKRWVARRKAEVLAAVRDGVLSREEACHRYSLSEEEFTAWQRSIKRHGLGGLRVTRLREFRSVG